MQPGRPEAARVVWNWREPPAGDARALRGARVRLVVSGVIALGVGSALALLASRGVAGGVILGLGLASVSTGSLAPPGVIRRLERAIAAAAQAVGIFLGAVLLAPVYFLVFAPFSLLLRRGRRDRLGRGFDRAAGTYWTKRAEPRRSAEHPF